MDIKDYLVGECVCFSLEATTKVEAIIELAGLLHEAGIVNSTEEYVVSVLEREREYTTGIGDSFAIPHGKCKAVNRAAIAFGKSSKGIEWQALDNGLVHNIFMLAIPEAGDSNHLEMISSLARKLMHKDVKEKVINAKELEEFYEAIQ